jgi:hypothetical protein
MRIAKELARAFGRRPVHPRTGFFLACLLLLGAGRLSAQTSDPYQHYPPGTPSAVWAGWLNNLTDQAVPQQTIGLGTFSISADSPGRLVWQPSVPSYFASSMSGCRAPGGGVVLLNPPLCLTLNSHDINYQIGISKPAGYDLQVVMNNPTVGGGPEQIVATVQDLASPATAGVVKARPQFPSPGSIATLSFHPRLFAMQTMNFYHAGKLLNCHFANTTLPCSFYIWPSLQAQLGAFVVPYVPIAVIYQPPGCGQCITNTPNGPVVAACGSRATFGQATAYGTTLSWVNSSSAGIVKTRSPQDFLNYISNVASAGSALAPDPASKAALKIIGEIADTLHALYNETVTTSHTVTWSQTESRGWSISDGDSWRTGLCQSTDTIVFVQNVLFAYAALPIDPVSNNVSPSGVPTVIIAPLKWDPPVHYTFSELQTMAESGTFDPVELERLLALRAQPPRPTNPNPKQSTQGSVATSAAPAVTIGHPGRLVQQPTVACTVTTDGNPPQPIDSPAGVYFSREELSSAGTSQATTVETVTEVSGLLASLLGNAGTTKQSVTFSTDETQWSSVTQSAQLELQCPEFVAQLPQVTGMEMDIYLDTLFDTLLAVPNGNLVTPDSPMRGTVTDQGQAVTNVPVDLRIGGKAYRVRSDSNGRFAFPFTSIPRGRGLLVVGKQSVPVEYNGMAVPELNLKLSTTAGIGIARQPITGAGAQPSPAAGHTNNTSPMHSAVPVPCCLITAVNASTGVVMAKVISTSQVFEFTVTNRTQVTQLQVGQPVYANFSNGQISLDGEHNDGQVGRILPTAAIKTPPIPAVSSDPNNASAQQSVPAAANPVTCCGIVGIDASTGVVTARVTSTGQQFQFTLSNSAQTRTLRAGQGIYANFSTRQVSLDGKTPAGTIVSVTGPGTAPNGATQTTSGETPRQANVSAGTAGLHPPQFVATKQIDPCSIPPADPADVLKALLSLGIKPYFPRAMQNGGEHIKLSDPEVEQVTCPNMMMTVKFVIEYRQTRGFPQFQVSGTVEMQSPLIGQVQYQPGANGGTVITQANFLRATAVLTDIKITALHLKNVPNWLDNTWLRACLNGQYSNWGCTDVVHQMSFDISNLVQVYLQQGHTL